VEVTFQPTPGRIQKLAKFLSSNSIKTSKNKFAVHWTWTKEQHAVYGSDAVSTKAWTLSQLCTMRVGQNCFWKQNVKQHFIITTKSWWRYSSYGTSGEQIETKPLRPARLLLERRRFITIVTGSPLRETGSWVASRKRKRILIHVRHWVSQVTEWV